jgi:hypothetical protein
LNPVPKSQIRAYNPGWLLWLFHHPWKIGELVREAIDKYISQIFDASIVVHPKVKLRELWDLWNGFGKGSDTEAIKINLADMTNNVCWHYAEGCKSTVNDPIWRSVKTGVKSLCLATGSSIAHKDPFDNIVELRRTVSRQLVYTVDLHNKISELNNPIIRQQRMITALAFRSVLENLSKMSKGSQPTDKWKFFWQSKKSRYEALHKDELVSSKDHPFTEFWSKYPARDVNTMAEDLYQTLSRTIHNFRSHGHDQYFAGDGQYDPVQADFMMALRPINRNSDGDIDWLLERKRYN